MSRLDRVASVLKNEISAILRKTINDSRIGFISIMRIKLSKDLHHAWVYYSQLGSKDDIEKTKRGLASASRTIESELFKVMHLQTIPRLHFRYDPSIEQGSNVLEQMSQLNHHEDPKQ